MATAVLCEPQFLAVGADLGTDLDALLCLAGVATGWLLVGALRRARAARAEAGPAQSGACSGPSPADGEPREALKPLPETPDFARRVLLLPGDRGADVSRCVDLADLAAAAAVSKDLRRSLWDAPEVWRARAADSALPPPVGAAAGSDGFLARDAFRKALFGVSHGRLRGISSGEPESVLRDASLVVRGAMPWDGEILEVLCGLAASALQGHDARCPKAAEAARSFLDAARRREDLWAGRGEGMAELEGAYEAALKTHDALEASLGPSTGPLLWLPDEDDEVPLPLLDEDEEEDGGGPATPCGEYSPDAIEALLLSLHGLRAAEPAAR